MGKMHNDRGLFLLLDMTPTWFQQPVTLKILKMKLLRNVLVVN